MKWTLIEKKITDINEGSKKQGRFENLEGVYTQNIVNKSILFL